LKSAVIQRLTHGVLLERRDKRGVCASLSVTLSRICDILALRAQNRAESSLVELQDVGG
jgi:hypothetical protein